MKARIPAILWAHDLTLQQKRERVAFEKQKAEEAVRECTDPEQRSTLYSFLLQCAWSALVLKRAFQISRRPRIMRAFLGEVRMTPKAHRWLSALGVMPIPYSYPQVGHKTRALFRAEISRLLRIERRVLGRQPKETS